MKAMLLFLIFVFIFSVGLNSIAAEQDLSITTGGYFRWSEEWFNHPNFGRGADESQGYFLQRYLLHVDIKDKANNVRWYLQGKYSEISNKFGNLSSLDRDDGDIHQAFFEGKNVRIGRQEVSMGSSLLIGIREGPNSRLSLDGAKIFSKEGQQWEFFLGHPVEISKDLLDNRYANTLISFLYLTAILKSELTQADAYLVYFEDDSHLYTLGSRVILQNANFNWDTDLLAQTGASAEKDVEAYGLASRLKVLMGTFDATLLASYFTGDKDPNDSKLNTFNALFPKGQYYSWSAEVGHSNLMTLQPGLIWHLEQNLTWTNSVGFLWRENIHDGVYRGNGTAFRPSTNQESFIGTQVNSLGEWAISEIFKFYFEYTYFAPGAFIRDSNASQDSQFFALRTAARF
jgi:hypothetical protein